MPSRVVSSLSIEEDRMVRPVTAYPGGRMIAATFTVAFEAFTRGGHFKKAKGLAADMEAGCCPTASALTQWPRPCLREVKRRQDGGTL